jgi:hypothetical protein
MSTLELYRELERRTSALLEREAALEADLAEVQAELGMIDGATGTSRPATRKVTRKKSTARKVTRKKTTKKKATGKKKTTAKKKTTRKKAATRKKATGKRVSNTKPLKTVLNELLSKKPMPTSEAADRVLKTGYKTKSKSFINNVTVALSTDKRFTLKDGKWHTSG